VNLMVAQLMKIFPSLHGARRFVNRVQFWAGFGNSASEDFTAPTVPLDLHAEQFLARVNLTNICYCLNCICKAETKTPPSLPT
jgi:hypothetical protein